MTMPRTLKLTGVLAAAALTLAGCASSDNASDDVAAYPEGDITFIVQAAAGGGSDLTSRALAAGLEKELGVSVIVENRPGASGSTAMQYMADADPDGYTIGFVPVEISMLGHQGFDIDPANYDFLGQIMLAPGVISVPNDSPFETLDDLVEAAQSGAVNMANSGPGSIWEAAELGLAELTGAQIVPVPFDGGAPAVAAVMGNQVDGAVGGTAETAAAHNGGQLRALAVLHDERHPLMPDVPTATELGYDLEFGGWGGVYAPAGLPDEVREALETVIASSAQSDTFVDTITTGGSLAVYKSADDFTTFVADEYTRFSTLLQAN
ncbi:tripartite tricarboxylate transporter substrate binding protein [Cryobacterium sp. N19]|uniref:tripartite tricarboxylate transporter substrate binding protein n=1 Tax=Cryobacterium sp. N19 TaxID=2048288 RepID=UPI000CE2F6A4|nr:tripartite tricarboxylate transporter substrate binding protein [Cryobacterium sp. N19]